MTGSRLRPAFIVGLFLGLLTISLQGVHGEEELEVPPEDLCRPYIEKALKDLNTGSLEQISAEIGVEVHKESQEDEPAASEGVGEPIGDTSAEDMGMEEERQESTEAEEVETQAAESAEGDAAEASTEADQSAEGAGDQSAEVTEQQSVEGAEEPSAEGAEEPSAEGADEPSAAIAAEESAEGAAEPSAEVEEHSVEGVAEQSAEAVAEESVEAKQSAEEESAKVPQRRETFFDKLLNIILPKIAPKKVTAPAPTKESEEQDKSGETTPKEQKDESAETEAVAEESHEAAEEAQVDEGKSDEEKAEEPSDEESKPMDEKSDEESQVEDVKSDEKADDEVKDETAEVDDTDSQAAETGASHEETEEAASQEEQVSVEASVEEKVEEQADEADKTGEEQSQEDGGVSAEAEVAESVEQDQAESVEQDQAESAEAQVEEEGKTESEEGEETASAQVTEEAKSAEDTTTLEEIETASVEEEAEAKSAEVETPSAEEGEAKSVEEEAETKSAEVELESEGKSAEEEVETKSAEEVKSEEDAEAVATEEAKSAEEGETKSVEDGTELKAQSEEQEEAKSGEEEPAKGESEELREDVKSRARREIEEEQSEEKAGEGEEGSKEEAAPSEEESTPEEDLIQEIIIPDNLRPREHINQLLKLDEENEEKERAIEKIRDIILRDLKKVYDNAIQPLESLYKYRDLSNRHFGDPEIFSKPLVLFMGPWSGGKSSIINYLLDIEYKHTSLRTGAEPSPAYFNILMHGEEEEILDGTQLAADWTFSGLQKFGQGMLDRLRGLKLNNKLLEKVNIVEIPGILEIRKQVQRLFPFNDACQWFIDRADIIFLVYDPSKLDVGPETEAILDQLKGRETQTRIILNKADQVKPEELMRVQGALIWNISPLMSSAEPPVMYSTSLWSLPYEAGAPTRLLYAQERAFLRDLRSAVDKRVEHKIASARRFAVRVRNHAKMVDCYLTTYYNHKTFFGNKKEISDKIVENPQDYHIYEGLSTLTNISRYDLPDPDVYRDFFRLNPLYDFQLLSSTCTYFRGCPINRLDIAIAYDLPELVGKYRKQVEQVIHEYETNTPPS